jgi:scyllo-inositol 2-dehydrogenase (NADP+)
LPQVIATVQSGDIRVALFGYGLGGESFHAPLIAVTPGLRLTTIVTSHPERRERARRAFPDAQLADSPEQVFERGRDLDLAVISTPNRTHVPLALAALHAGLGVVVDKPFAASAEDARRVVVAARQAQRFLSAYHIRRWDGELLTVKRLLSEGALGEVLRFESRLDRWRPLVRDVWRERGAPEEAGGLLFDLGSHLIDQALHLFGRVDSVYAELDRRRTGVVVDDDVFIALTHASGVRSHLGASLVAAQRGIRMRVLGSRAAYVKSEGDFQERQLRAGLRPDRADWGTEPEEHWGWLGVEGDVRRIRSEAGAYQSFYAGVVASLRTGAPPPVAPEDAVAGLEIIAAAQRSAAERSTITMSERT